jgi:hypothetical protein
MVASGLGHAILIDPKPACDALLEALRDPAKEVRIDAMKSLAHFREVRAIPIIRDLVMDSSTMSLYDAPEFVDAIVTIGGPEAVGLLEEMMITRREVVYTESALVRLGSPTTGRVVWKEYLKAPFRIEPNMGGDVWRTGYEDDFDLLTTCTDVSLLLEIRKRREEIGDTDEKWFLQRLISRIEARLSGDKSKPTD